MPHRTGCPASRLCSPKIDALALWREQFASRELRGAQDAALQICNVRLVVAIILGPLADENLRRSLFLFEGKSLWSIFIDHPIGTVLIVVVLYTFYDGIFRRRD